MIDNSTQLNIELWYCVLAHLTQQVIEGARACVHKDELVEGTPLGHGLVPVKLGQGLGTDPHEERPDFGHLVLLVLAQMVH